MAAKEEIGQFVRSAEADYGLPIASIEANSAVVQVCLESTTFDGSYAAYFACLHSAAAMAHRLNSLEQHPGEYLGPEQTRREQVEQSRLLRCVIGNPFRPVRARPDWLTSTSVALAQSIYADRAFDRLPILADALEDAGCGDAELLAHCRGEGPHVKGCWAVDLVLGKE